MHRTVIAAAVALACAGGAANSEARGEAKTLRATYIATNPVQAAIDPASGKLVGPGAAIAREVARRLDAQADIAGLASPAAVIDSVSRGDADIGLVAFDPARAADITFCEVYALAQNTYMVRADSPLHSVAEIDRPGIKVGVTARDTADLVLTRTLTAAEIRRNTTGRVDTAVQWLMAGTVDAYGTNRQRLTALAAAHPGYRLLTDNFYGVPQAVVVRKDNATLCATVDAVIDEARASGLLAQAIAGAGLAGVDVAPPRPR